MPPATERHLQTGFDSLRASGNHLARTYDNEAQAQTGSGFVESAEISRRMAQGIRDATQQQIEELKKGLVTPPQP